MQPPVEAERKNSFFLISACFLENLDRRIHKFCGVFIFPCWKYIPLFPAWKKFLSITKLGIAIYQFFRKPYCNPFFSPLILS
jgi:hypothetical protein